MIRFVITAEQIEGNWRVHCIGPDRKPVNAMGSGLQWPMRSIAEHMIAATEKHRTGENPEWMHDGSPRAFDPDAGKAA